MTTLFDLVDLSEPTPPHTPTTNPVQPSLPLPSGFTSSSSITLTPKVVQGGWQLLMPIRADAISSDPHRIRLPPSPPPDLPSPTQPSITPLPKAEEVFLQEEGRTTERVFSPRSVASIDSERSGGSATTSKVSSLKPTAEPFQQQRKISIKSSPIPSFFSNDVPSRSLSNTDPAGSPIPLNTLAPSTVTGPPASTSASTMWHSRYPDPQPLQYVVEAQQGFGIGRDDGYLGGLQAEVAPEPTYAFRGSLLVNKHPEDRHFSLPTSKKIDIKPVTTPPPKQVEKVPDNEVQEKKGSILSSVTDKAHNERVPSVSGSPKDEGSDASPLDQLVREMSKFTLQTEGDGKSDEDREQKESTVSNDLHGDRMPNPQQQAVPERKPSQPRSDTGDSTEDSLWSLVEDTKDRSQILRDAYSDFMATLEENLFRMKSLTKAQIEVDETARLQTMVNDLRNRNKELQQAITALEDERREMKASWAVHTMEKEQWELARAVLGAKHVKLEEEYRALLADKAASRPRQRGCMVLLQGDPRMFHDESLASGYDGGVQAARGIRRRVDEVWQLRLHPVKLEWISVYLLIDIPTVQRVLLENGIITQPHVFRDFLDGLNEENDLNALVDIEEGHHSLGKLRANLLRALSSNEYACIVVGSHHDDLADIVTNAPLEKLFAVKMRDDSDAVWAKVLGADRVIPIPGLYTLDQREWNDASVILSGALSSATPSILESAPLRAGTESPDTIMSERTQLPPPPWQVSPAPPTPPASETLPMTSALGSTSESRGSLLDAYYAQRAQREAQGHLSTQGSVISEPSILSSGNNSRASIGRGGSIPKTSAIVIPIDPDLEGSELGGSPPESDEDEPSVKIPHSAKRFIQRPTVVADDDGGSSYRSRSTTPRPYHQNLVASSMSMSSPSVAAPPSASVPVQLQGRNGVSQVSAPSIAAPRPPPSIASSTASSSKRYGKSRRGSSGSNANLIPLGSSSRSNAAQNMFDTMRARRQTGEYQKLSRLALLLAIICT